jgi:ribosome-binding protein aMBF1 (putative translation factor)
MRCRECPAYKWDAEHICLLCCPEIPEQLQKLMSDGIELTSCNMFAEYRRATGN